MDHQDIEVASVSSKSSNFIRLLALFIGGFSIWLGYDLLVLGITIQSKLPSPGNQTLNLTPGLFVVAAGVLIVACALFRKDSSRLSQEAKHSSSREAQVVKSASREERDGILEVVRSVILEDRLAIIKEAAIMAGRRLSGLAEGDKASSEVANSVKVASQSSSELNEENKEVVMRGEEDAKVTEIFSLPELTDEKSASVDVPFYRKAIAFIRASETEGSGPNWSNVDDYDIPTVLRKQMD